MGTSVVGGSRSATVTGPLRRSQPFDNAYYAVGNGQPGVTKRLQVFGPAGVERPYAAAGGAHGYWAGPAAGARVGSDWAGGAPDPGSAAGRVGCAVCALGRKLTGWAISPGWCCRGRVRGLPGSSTSCDPVRLYRGFLGARWPSSLHAARHPANDAARRACAQARWRRGRGAAPAARTAAGAALAPCRPASQRAAWPSELPRGQLLVLPFRATGHRADALAAGGGWNSPAGGSSSPRDRTGGPAARPPTRPGSCSPARAPGRPLGWQPRKRPSRRRVAVAGLRAVLGPESHQDARAPRPPPDRPRTGGGARGVLCGTEPGTAPGPAGRRGVNGPQTRRHVGAAADERDTPQRPARRWPENRSARAGRCRHVLASCDRPSRRGHVLAAAAGRWPAAAAAVPRPPAGRAPAAATSGGVQLAPRLAAQVGGWTSWSRRQKQGALKRNRAPRTGKLRRMIDAFTDKYGLTITRVARSSTRTRSRAKQGRAGPRPDVFDLGGKGPWPTPTCSRLPGGVVRKSRSRSGPQAPGSATHRLHVHRLHAAKVGPPRPRSRLLKLESRARSR